MINYSLERIAQVCDGEVIGDKSCTINGIQIDSRLVKDGMMFAPIIGEKVNGHSFVAQLLSEKKISASFWQKDQPNIPKGNVVIVDDVIKAMQKLAENYRDTMKTQFIGVTGSVGKTSTKDLLAAVLKVKYQVEKTFENKNNIIGVPLTILNLRNDNDYAVIEMCITDFNQMDLVCDIVKPHYCIITNIANSHIQQLKSLDNIVVEKCKITKHLNDGQCFYFNEAYGLKEHLNSLKLQNKPLSYGFENNADYVVENYNMSKNGMSFVYNNEQYEIPLLGKHQVGNALGVIAIAKMIGLTTQEINKGFMQVDMTPHRLQIKHINAATVIDDTYNCNPTSLAASLNTVLEYGSEFDVYACLGDMLELGEDEIQLHIQTIKKIDYSKFKQVILTGKLMKHLYDELNSRNIKCVYFEKREDLKNYLKNILALECVIIFKASGGMEFSKLVYELEG